MRKSITVSIDDRGKQLQFKITEMPATKLERWLTRALLLIAAANKGEADDGVDLQVAASHLASQGLRALANVRYEDAEPLLEEMLNCCTRIDAGVDQKCTSDSVDGYIEDVQTLFKLRMEAMKLNLSFFTESPSTSQSNDNTLKLKVPASKA